MKMVYGPVSSWRLGRSLGVDLICSKKRICSYDCIYCQLGKPFEKRIHREKFISIKKFRSELLSALQKTSPDVITFSGTGEPTLAENIDHAVEIIRDISKTPIAILTNSSLMNREEVRNSLSKLDIVVAKIDTHNEDTFQRINKPANNINLKETIEGIKKFKQIFSGKLSIQIMFILENYRYAGHIARIIKELNPDEIQLNTPLRPCPVQPLIEKQISHIEEIFRDNGLSTISIYKSEKPKTSPLDKMELIKRRRSEI